MSNLRRCLPFFSDARTRFAGGSSLALLILLLALLLVTSGCGRGEAGAAQDDVSQEGAESAGEEAEELPPVEVAALERGRIESVLRFSTNLEAESEVQVFSQAARQVTELKVEEGDRVRKGDLLLRLQNDEQLSSLARAESQLRKAHREYERQKNLFGKELISEQAFNDATYEVEQMELAKEDAERDLTYTEVRAPISGTITARAVNLGDQITVNQHLFDIVDFNSIVARVYVPEREVGRLALEQEARLFADSLSGEERRGEVLRIAPVVDPRSGTVKVTVSIPRNQELLPGMYVEVELVTDVHTDALLIPKRSVIYDNNQAFVYRLKGDDTVEQLFFDVALTDRDFVKPLGNAMAVGDQIVTAGQAGLKSGAKVRLATGLVTASMAEASEGSGEDTEANGLDGDADSAVGDDS